MKDLTRTSKAYADLLAAVGATAQQLRYMISFGLTDAFEGGTEYQLDRLEREEQAAQYPKNWLLIKVPWYTYERP